VELPPGQDAGLEIPPSPEAWVEDMFTGYAMTITGPGALDIPDRPLTRQEFHALLSDLAARGYLDNLLP